MSDEKPLSITSKINSDLILHESRSQDPDARSLAVMEELSCALNMFFQEVWNKGIDLKTKTVAVTISLEEKNPADFYLH